jgi:hypothetical protein
VIVLDGQVHGKETPEAATRRALEVVSQSMEELELSMEVE